MIELSVLRPSQTGRGWRVAPLVLRGILLGLVLFSPRVLTAEEKTPLHHRIDQLIAETTFGIAAPVVGDAEFLRRVSLDLIGIPPSVEQLRAFLADQNPAKREAAVDALLSHPRYVRHMADVLDVMLMERRPYQHVTEDEWRQYLLNALRENRPYNQLAKEILAADGAEPNPRAAARFYLDRQADPHLLTRDVGRIFFGRDLQCAQCHDHPLILDYHQADYHGLLAFFQSSAAFTAAPPDGKTYYIENAGTSVVFESVFVNGKHTTGPKLLGLPEVEEPPLYPDDQYEVKPAANVRPVPKFSRRARLADLATNGSNRAFNENIANRLWAHMMGNGLVEPVDFHHSANPPSNPALLRALGEEFAASRFDVKAFLRTLALTQTYQRSIDPPSDPLGYAALAASLASELENRLQKVSAATSQADKQYTDAVKECCVVEETTTPVAADLEQAMAAATQAATKLDDAKAQLAAAQAQIVAKAAVSQVLTEAVAKTQEVAKALPQDQELIQAAQKFAERQQQFSTEVDTLAKDAEQKTAAVNESQQAVAASRQGIDAVRAKFSPFAEAFKQRKQLVTAARQLWTDQEIERSSLEERLHSLRQLARLEPLQEQIAAAKSRVTAAEKAVAEARQTAEAQQATIGASEKARQAAEQQLQQAAAAVATAKQEYERAEQLMATVGEAVAKTEAAQKLLPDDSSLVQASASLSTKLKELKTEAEVLKRKFDEATASEQTAQQQLAAASEQLTAAATEMSQRQQKVAEAEQALSAVRAEIDERTSKLGDSLAALEAEWTKTFAVLPLKPLTPEQMCWSILQVTGVYDRYIGAERAELDKSAPLSEDERKDPAKVAAREWELHQRVYDKLKANVAVFVSMYAPAAGQPQDDFFASAGQALFAANGGSVTSWTSPAAANVTELMIQQPDPKAAAEELYLAVLSRFPDEAEIADVTRYLTARSEDKAACVQELVWGLLTSVEFRFNH